jgi:hypothetical protein
VLLNFTDSLLVFTQPLNHIGFILLYFLKKWCFAKYFEVKRELTKSHPNSVEDYYCLPGCDAV